MYSIKIKRIYAPPGPEDGYRVLADRLWPRGIGKEAARLDAWERAVAPTSALRKSFGHRPECFGAFRDAYLSELDNNPAAAEFCLSCKAELETRNVTLLYAAKDGTCSNASVLCEWLKRQTERGNQNG